MNLTDLQKSQHLNWESLDEEINVKKSSDFIKQFKKIFKSKKACEAKNVVYAWTTKSDIPRLRGESNILYFGKTDNTLYDRHYKYAKIEGNEHNWHRYEHIINNFGPIKVYYARTADPKKVESELLKQYYIDHCEYPPVNRSSR